VGKARFIEDRHVAAGSQASVPLELCPIHHMSYARSDDQILRKITTFSHAREVVPGWFERIWRGWDADRTLENLNPCWPAAYRRIVDQSYDALPPVLRRLRDRDELESLARRDTPENEEEAVTK
jgi:hypothetical protein